MAELNALPEEDFVEFLGGVFEHSPWIARAVVGGRPFANLEKLLEGMVRVVRESSEDVQLALIQAHPDLAGRLAQRGELTAESAREQAAAGLGEADAETLRRISECNDAYRARFQFPFIICARLNKVESILTAMEERLCHETMVERETALVEIEKIAHLRLLDLVPETL